MAGISKWIINSGWEPTKWERENEIWNDPTGKLNENRSKGAFSRDYLSDLRVAWKSIFNILTTEYRYKWIYGEETSNGAFWWMRELFDICSCQCRFALRKAYLSIAEYRSCFNICIRRWVLGEAILQRILLWGSHKIVLKLRNVCAVSTRCKVI